MNDNILLTLVELFFSLVIEGVIFAGIFSHISNKNQKQEQLNLQQEMSNIETQNKFIYEQIHIQIEEAKTEIISQIKESEYKKGVDKT